MTVPAVAPLTPHRHDWEPMPMTPVSEYPARAFWQPLVRLYVISAVEVVDPRIGPEYHLTVSKQTERGARRCTSAEAAMVLLDFEALAAEEDNHTSIVRSFWLPVNEALIGHTCPCKDREAVVREGDFEWRPVTQASYDRARRRQEQVD